MKQILFYGDSYVYGKIPGGSRYGFNERFSTIVRTKLGSGYHVIEEGLRGRMLYGENMFFANRDGYKQFGPIIGSHLPLDLIIFVLGANDCNSKNSLTPSEIANKYDKYLEEIQKWCDFHKCDKPKIIITTPPIIDEISAANAFGEIFKGASSKSQALIQEIGKKAKELSVPVIHFSDFVKVSKVDGVHLDLDANKRMGDVLYNEITRII